MEHVDVSIVIPAYKESDRILKNLSDITSHMKMKNLSYEILIVVDGSPDDTAVVSRAYAQEHDQNVRVIENELNHGKGYVVRQGLMEAVGAYRVFLDADGSTAISHVDKAFDMLNSGVDFVVGSRDIAGAHIQIHQPWHREIMGTAGNWLIRIVLGLWRFPDTQCGFKAMKAEVAQKVVSQMVVDRFGFDFEMIVLAKKMKFKIVQMPVTWLNEEGSTVGLTGPNGFIQVVIDLFKTRWRLIVGSYQAK